MKSQPILIFLAFSVITFSAMGQEEHTAVAKAVNYYLDGGTNNDFETLKKAFHPDATMRWIGEDYTDVNALEFFESRMKPGPPQNRETRIAMIDVTGNAATAKLEIEYPTFTFIDYMNLLKIEGEWKIISKIFYRRTHDEKS